MTVKQDTPVEQTRCGSCAKFENECPHGTTKAIGLVYSFFAQCCDDYEKKERCGVKVRDNGA